VSNGLAFKMEVFRTDDEQQWGVKMLESVPVGSFICEITGQASKNCF
jgi:hypothetical protein